MCSRSSPDLIITKPNIDLISDICRKCPEQASVVLQSKFSYCRECFMVYFKHKFRATLGKSKIMKHGDKILIGFSGTAPSLCLIDLINNSLNDENKRKMSFDINILHIDESLLLNSSDQTEQVNLEEIKRILKPYNFQLYSTDLGAYLASALTLNTNNLYTGSNKLEKIKEIFLKCKTLSSKTDLLVKIRYNILFKVANTMGCQKIFSAETSDHLAINTISNIVQGRGAQLKQDIGFCDDRTVTDLVLVRPLQDCSKKEVTYYNVFNNLKPLTTPTFGTKEEKYSSIQKLSESFINELQCSFPSTVLTIRGTGSKLSAVTNLNADSFSCCLCHGKLDTSITSLTAYQASHISRLISNLGPLKFNSVTFTPDTPTSDFNEESDDKLCSRDNCTCRACPDNNESIFCKNVDKFVCYGCQLILKDYQSLESLPREFIIKLQEGLQYNKMHDEIKSFLL